MYKHDKEHTNSQTNEQTEHREKNNWNWNTTPISIRAGFKYVSCSFICCWWWFFFANFFYFGYSIKNGIETISAIDICFSKSLLYSLASGVFSLLYDFSFF